MQSSFIIRHRFTYPHNILPARHSPQVRHPQYHIQHLPPYQVTSSTSSDLAQASRLAQFDLMRYNHHSTLLYAVPPSSVGCLDLLVGLYGWAGGLLDETPQKPASPPHRARIEVTSTTNHLKETLSSSLAHLARTRSTLLEAWAQRNQQTQLLEDEAARKQLDADDRLHTPDLGRNDLSPLGIEHKARKQKLHRSVGGRLRDFLTTSASSTSLAGMAERVNGDRSGRMSFDQSPGHVRDLGISSTTIIPESAMEEEIEPKSSLLQTTIPFPASKPTVTRPDFSSRHSLQLPRGDYISPFLAPFNSPQGIGFGARTERDEDTERVEVGRKKEGVLWGAGVWEGVSKSGGKGKWESEPMICSRRNLTDEVRVLGCAGSLSHLRSEFAECIQAIELMLQYRDNGLGRPETAHATIDLKFASVREGRGTERRFGEFHSRQRG